MAAVAGRRPLRSPSNIISGMIMHPQIAIRPLFTVMPLRNFFYGMSPIGGPGPSRRWYYTSQLPIPSLCRH